MKRLKIDWERALAWFTMLLVCIAFWYILFKHAVL
jgi:hypothetical protein